jgi:S1-C subfamily serine protease
MGGGMKSLIRSQFAASMLGGAVVAIGFLALGVTGRRSTREVVAQSPASSAADGLTPHDIYVRDAAGVVLIRARVIQGKEDRQDAFADSQGATSTGSGFLIDDGGDILTNFHVVDGADRTTGVKVYFEDGITRRATVAGVERSNDLAVLRVDMNGVPDPTPLQLGDSRSVEVGDPTLTISNPFGLDRTLTSGIVSALQRQIAAPDGTQIDNVIQTDAPVSPDNSGGPLLDATGRVIGINSQMLTPGAGTNGTVRVAFAVPIDTAKALLPKLEAPTKR